MRTSDTGDSPQAGTRNELSGSDCESTGPARRAPGAQHTRGHQTTGDYETPSNSLVTEPSPKTSEMARASSGAIGMTVSLSNRRSSLSGSVLVTTTSLIREFFSRLSLIH